MTWILSHWSKCTLNIKKHNGDIGLLMWNCGDISQRWLWRCTASKLASSSKNVVLTAKKSPKCSYYKRKRVSWLGNKRHSLGQVDNFTTVLVQIHSGICVSKVIKIERYWENKRVQFFCPTVYLLVGRSSNPTGLRTKSDLRYARTFHAYFSPRQLLMINKNKFLLCKSTGHMTLRPDHLWSTYHGGPDVLY